MHRSNFDIAVNDWLLRKDVEGVHSNSPHDRGGDTWYGISRKYHPNEPWPPTRERCVEIYREEYWDHRNLDLDKIDAWPVQLVVFDAAVQHDPTDAAIFLQAALNRLSAEPRLVVDGWAGAKTRAKLAQVTNWDPERELLVAMAVLWERVGYYRELAADPGQLNNLRGWMGRCIELANLLTAGKLEARP